MPDHQILPDRIPMDDAISSFEIFFIRTAKLQRMIEVDWQRQKLEWYTIQYGGIWGYVQNEWLEDATPLGLKVLCEICPDEKLLCKLQRMLFLAKGHA